jgi:hypothetical protein
MGVEWRVLLSSASVAPLSVSGPPPLTKRLCFFLPVWQGPIPAEPFLRSFGFLPADKPHVDVRHHAALASPKIAKHFSLEVFFQCTGHKDLARYIVRACYSGVCMF